jgi:hypothetical protein
LENKRGRKTNMTQTIKGDLILTEDTIIKSNLVVEGDIRGY